jgi:hypothetical protein
MQLSSLVDVFALAFSNPVNNLFSWVMVFIFVVSILNTIGVGVFRQKWAQHLADSAPGLLPTLGILGTFVGICIGLLSFKTSSLEQSVPLLLEGLKTSFVTSVVGVFFAVVLKFSVAVIGNREGQSATVDDAIFQIAGSIKLVASSHAETAETLRRIRSSIASLLSLNCLY